MLSCRQVLNLLTMLGFMLNYALRGESIKMHNIHYRSHLTRIYLAVNLSIAIVDMTVPNVTAKVDVNGSLAMLGANFTNSSSSSNITDTEEISQNGVNVKEERFNWDSYQTNFVLGSFFWGYVLTELPGGRLAELIGGRRVFGHSMLWASVLTLITPLAAHLSYVMLIVVRVALGFMLGASWPAIHPVAAVWIPPMERSKFMSNMMGKCGRNTNI